MLPARLLKREAKTQLQFAGATALGLILLGVGFWISRRVPRSNGRNVSGKEHCGFLPFDNFGDEKKTPTSPMACRTTFSRTWLRSPT